MILNKTESYKSLIKLSAIVVAIFLIIYTFWTLADFYWLNGLKTANESEFTQTHINDHMVMISASSLNSGSIYRIFNLQEIPFNMQDVEYSPKSFYFYSCLFGTIFGGIPIILIGLLSLMFLRNIYKERIPFTLKNAKLLKIIACTLIVYSVIENGIADAFMYKYVFNTFWFELHMVYINRLALMCGVILLMISVAFSYGIYLQEEYDDTV